jgi:hypothetical protein
VGPPEVNFPLKELIIYKNMDHITLGWKLNNIMNLEFHKMRGTYIELIYLLTAIWLPPGGSCAIHIYTQTIHRTTQNKQYIEQHKNFEKTQKFWKSAGRTPTWRVIPWHLPYN